MSVKTLSQINRVVRVIAIVSEQVREMFCVLCFVFSIQKFEKPVKFILNFVCFVFLEIYLKTTVGR